MITISVASATDRRAIDSGPPQSGERRRVGRPRIGKPVLVCLPDDLHADLCAEARAEGHDNVSEIIRARCAAGRFRISETPLA